MSKAWIAFTVIVGGWILLLGWAVTTQEHEKNEATRRCAPDNAILWAGEYTCMRVIEQ
jgi:hypothetical protein